MIRPTGNYRAAYKDQKNGHNVWHYRPVEAWDDDGDALVLNEQRGRLVRADTWTNFDGVTEGDRPIIAAIPGGGWLVEWTNDDGTKRTEPLLAWAVNSGGWATPIDADADGIAMPLEEDSKGWKLIPPGTDVEATR